MTNWRVSDNERAWIEFLRLITNGSDPAPDLKSVQILRRALGGRLSQTARHSPDDPKIRNQGVPFPLAASVDPTCKPGAQIATKGVVKS